MNIMLLYVDSTSLKTKQDKNTRNKWAGYLKSHALEPPPVDALPPHRSGVSFVPWGARKQPENHYPEPFSKCVSDPRTWNEQVLRPVFQLLRAQGHSSPLAFPTRCSYHVHVLPVCTFEADSSQKPALYHLPSERGPSPDGTVLSSVLCVRLN